MTQQRSPEQPRAYIGSFTSAGGRGVTVATVDGTDGALRPAGHTGTAVPDPSYLALADGVLYAVCERDEGAVAALSPDLPGLPPLPGGPVPVRGAAPTHLAVAGGLLFTANYTSGSVSVLPLGADGAPGGGAAAHQHRGSGPDTSRQSGPHAHAVVPDPSGRWLLAVDLGTDSVWVYTSGAGSVDGVRPHREVPLRPGTGPRHLAFHPSGELAYVINELIPTVTVCRWDARTGLLEPGGETLLVPDDGGTGPRYPSELVVRGDGRVAWAAVRGEDTVAVLSLGDDGTRPELVTSVPCGGHWPRDLALHPSGRWLYAANERSGDVTWFTLDEETGVPRRGGAVEAPAASCVVFG